MYTNSLNKQAQNTVLCSMHNKHKNPPGQQLKTPDGRKCWAGNALERVYFPHSNNTWTSTQQKCKIRRVARKALGLSKLAKTLLPVRQVGDGWRNADGAACQHWRPGCSAPTGRLKTQVRKTQVRICNDGKRKYSNIKSILKSLRFSSLAFSVDPPSVGLDQFTCTVPDRCYTQVIGLMLDSCAEGPGFKNRRRDAVE